jgi:hypothetical protein
VLRAVDRRRKAAGGTNCRQPNGLAAFAFSRSIVSMRVYEREQLRRRYSAPKLLVGRVGSRSMTAMAPTRKRHPRHPGRRHELSGRIQVRGRSHHERHVNHMQTRLVVERARTGCAADGKQFAKTWVQDSQLSVEIDFSLATVAFGPGGPIDCCGSTRDETRSLSKEDTNHQIRRVSPNVRKLAATPRCRPAPRH